MIPAAPPTVVINWHIVRELVRLGLAELSVGDVAALGTRVRLLVCARVRGLA